MELTGFESFNANFYKLMKKSYLQLPMKWKGNCFSSFVKGFLQKYINDVEILYLLDNDNIKILNDLCSALAESLESFYEGKPVKAYTFFKNIIDEYLYKGGTGSGSKFVFYNKTDYFGEYDDPLTLCRVRQINEEKRYKCGICQVSCRVLDKTSSL
jgi:hypothetical protein